MLSDHYATFKKSIYERWEIMEDAFLDSYWESQFEVQQPHDHYWEVYGEAYLAQWD